MRRRLNLSRIKSSLAQEMWGEILEKREYMSGLNYYKCQFYNGFIVDDKNFDISSELKKKIEPMTIIEIYNHRKERYIIERTNKDEKIPDNLASKFKNRRYSERINVYAFTGIYMDILKYYHTNILRHIFDNNLDDKALKYKSYQGYLNSEKRTIMRYLALNSPELVQNKDKKRAKAYLKKTMEKKVKNFQNKNKGIKQEEVELIKDNILQRIEVLCG